MEENFSELASWIMQKKNLTEPIDLDLDLIDGKILDSLSFVEYVLVIEELSGIEAVIGDDLVEKTRSLARVKKNFFAAQT